MGSTIGETRQALIELTQRLEALGRFLDLSALRHRLAHIDAQSSASGFWDDQDAAQVILRERSGIEDSLAKFKSLTQEISEAQELLDLAATENDVVVHQQIDAQLPNIERSLRGMEVARMLSGPQDRSDAIVTIHPGAGGTEAQDWAEMLMRMYLRWCERRGFRTETVDLQPGEEAGIKGASFLVQGPYAYGYLRAESGVHRLIRISPYDSNARRHTSFAAVFVVPDLDDDVGEIEIKPEDLRVDTFRSSGAGGQHVNKTESAIRITHLPSGIVVQCQAERSQHKNRSTAMKMLRGRLFERARQEREAAFANTYANSKMDIGFGSQVRSYTLAPYRLVKDERTEHKAGNVDAVLDGDLDDFIEIYLMAAAHQDAQASPKTENMEQSRG
ncbi:MAG: peptide chain release factor 2 [Myxococcales bacterium]|nr:peptide chain release factor 2 [Myxococcales bacterium]